MAETDVPTKTIPHGLKVPAGWKLADVKSGCFYWTRKGSSSYKENCVVCNHQFNGINVARLSKKIRYGKREGSYVCGGNCWGTYLGMDDWEQCPCGICISWCQYIEKLREPDHQRSPFDGPPDEADAKASQDSASAAQMCIENQRGESGRASHGDPRTLKEIMQQNTRLLEQQENLRGLLVELLELEEELSPQSASWLQTTRRAIWSAESCELATAWREEGGNSLVVIRI